MAHFFKGRVPSVALQIRLFLEELINMKIQWEHKAVVQNTYLWGRELGMGRWAHSDLQIESTQSVESWHLARCGPVPYWAFVWLFWIWKGVSLSLSMLARWIFSDSLDCRRSFIAEPYRPIWASLIFSLRVFEYQIQFGIGKQIILLHITFAMAEFEGNTSA